MLTERKYIIFIIIALIIICCLNFLPTINPHPSPAKFNITKPININPKTATIISLVTLGCLSFFIYGIFNLARFTARLKQDHKTFPDRRENTAGIINNLSFLKVVNFALFLYILGYIASILLTTTYELSSDAQLNFLVMFNMTWSLILLFFLNKLVPLKNLGVKNKNRQNYYIIKLYSATVVVLIIATMITAYISKFFGVQIKPHPVTEIIMNMDNKLLLYLLIIQITLLAPLTEELLFRGIIFNYLRKNFNWLISAITTSGIFAALHKNIFGFAGIFILSLSLCFLYEKKHKIINPIILHSIHNSLGVALMLSLKLI
jgi:hypothetical protein